MVVLKQVSMRHKSPSEPPMDSLMKQDMMLLMDEILRNAVRSMMWPFFVACWANENVAELSAIVLRCFCNLNDVTSSLVYVCGIAIQVYGLQYGTS